MENKDTKTVERMTRQFADALYAISNGTAIESAVAVLVQKLIDDFDLKPLPEPARFANIPGFKLCAPCLELARNWGLGRAFCVSCRTFLESASLLLPVGELKFSVRTMNCLHNGNIHYVFQLVQKREGELLTSKNFGRKSLKEIQDVLSERNLSLGMRFDV